MEKPIYPSPYMRITQGYNEGTHVDSFALDEAGMDSGIDYILAPFTGVIKKIYRQDANEVWLESLEPVEYPDGTIDYMTMMFAHSNDVSNLFIGKKINQKDRFYFEGTKGNATGNHCHFECGKGKFTGTGWHANGKGYWIINNSKNPTECLWIDDSIRILDSHGYTFKKVETKVEPEPEQLIKQLPTPPVEETKEERPFPKLIFTTPKDDVYAIKLRKNDKVYIERD